MRGSLLAVAVLATIAISTAVDEECVQRKVRGLPVHWPNPTDCSSFYRCTNKNIKRELLCPEGKEYNPSTGRCASIGKSLCKLSLIAPLTDAVNPCADELSGSYVPDDNSCRGFNICNNNVAYPQVCDLGSFFNKTLSACEPDTEAVCWENLCVKQEDGDYIPNDKDCYSFYICNDEKPVAQKCPEGSYFNKDNLTCEPGECPSDTTTQTTTPIPTTETTTPATDTTATVTQPTETTTKSTETETQTTATVTQPTETTTKSTETETQTTATVTQSPTTTPEITTPTTTPCTAETTSSTTTPCTATTTTTTCTTTTTTTTCTTTTTATTTTTCTTTTTTTTTTTCTTTTTTTTCTTTTTATTTTTCTTTTTTTTTTTCTTTTTSTTTTTCTTTTTTCTTTTTLTNTTCVPKEDSVCPSSNCLKKPDYFTFPASNTTSGFCRCLNDEATYYNCADDTYEYSAELGFCVKSDDCEEETTSTEVLCQGLYKEGDFVANPDNRMLFYICYDGELEASSCETGNYYDDEIKACMPDFEGMCPECHQPQPVIGRSKRSIKRAPVCMEGSKTPAADCDKYYKCVNGVQMLYGCGKDRYFSLETLSCEYDLEHKCWPATNCKSGEKTPHPFDCDKYFECCGGTEVLKECGKDYYFNKFTKDCTYDSKHVCWKLEPCTCPGGYKEGETSPHPDDCDKFYICYDGKQVLQDCGKGNYFNKTTGTCEKDEDGVCVPGCVCPGGYKSGQMSPHPKDCDKYYICVDGQQILQECGKDSYFDNTTRKCEPDVYNECWAKPACTCPGGYSEGDFSPHPTDCNKYYICSDGHQVLTECGVDEYFNNVTSRCERDEYHVCWPNLCVGQPTGSLVANPQQCNAYYLCEDDESTPGSCYVGEYFNAEEGTCLPDFKAICYDPCANETSGSVLLLPHPICNKYYFCNGGKTFVGECIAGSFDINTGVCNETKICEPNPCKNQPNYISFPYPWDPTKYFMCINGQAVLEDCLPNQEFDIDREICMPVSNRDCPACPNLETAAYPTLDGEDERAYCYCYQGVAYKSECSNGYTFNSDLGRCYSNASCEPGFCTDKSDYTVTENRNCAKSFCMCINHKPTIVNCPNNGTFNPFINECTKYEISPECDQTSCQGKADGQLGSFIKGKTYNGLCVCRGQIGTFEPCGYGSNYNPTLQICQLKEINCNSKLCANLADNTKIPALTTTEGYCNCVKGQATYFNCPNSGIFNEATSECDAPACPLANCKYPGDSFKPTNATDAVCLCLVDSVDYVPCDVGQLFSPEFGSCVDKCPLSSCPPNQPNYNVPSAVSLHNYCTCDGLGNAVFKECSPQYYSYDVPTQQCLPNAKTLCTKPCTTVIEAYEAEGTLEGYCVCDGRGKVEFEPCDNGTIYNPGRGVCVPTADSLCDVQCCAGATIDNPITMPAEDNDESVFCYCSGPDDVMVLTCPAGKVYVQSKGMCVNPLESESQCPAGVDEGDKVPDKTACNKYFVCDNGQLVAQTCPKGQYFNQNTNNCCVDSNNICPAPAECSCLGAYYEGEMLTHPLYDFMYYVCESGSLHEYKCPKSQVFSAYQKTCVKQRSGLRKRSIEFHEPEFGCLDNEKRSVPSNCSQYEICVKQNWQRETCPDYRYYNPEQKKCLEPRDDYVCSYARVTSLPLCDNSLEKQVYPAKSCLQYYQCQNGKWRLNSCGREHYFEELMKTCVAIDQTFEFKCEAVNNRNMTKLTLSQASTCQHLSQRFYPKNCAMFLMCLDNEWWYQYCPVGMYFNRTLNYCVPDVEQQCKDVVKSATGFPKEEYLEEVCSQDGLLRPSAMACNRYFVCLNGKWQMQHCARQEFYDVENAKCSKDNGGQCSKLNSDCWLNEKRSVNRNCSLYEQCSSESKWLEMACKTGEVFDELLQQCVPNQGMCSKHGLKRVCKDHELLKVNKNCTQFYYCSQDSWQIGHCLKGFVFLDEVKQCVPHQAEDTCRPFNTTLEDETALISPEGNEELCKGRIDGSSAAHPLDCTKYYICMQQTSSHEMRCPKGSYFDKVLGYCKPNDGSCRVPLTGVCTNSTDDSLVPHPTDCQYFYHCSSFNGTELLQCPTGEYFHNLTLQCIPDNGECKKDSIKPQMCSSVNHGSLIPHETYCNIYYACVKGLAIPAECPDNYQFNAVLSKCVYDKDQECQKGQLVNDNSTHSCGNLTFGSYIPDHNDCTRYFICSQGEALPKRCANNSYFDSEQLLCVPDDGSCPFVNDENGQHKPTKPDPAECEGKHGYLMADPFNCNNFYACIHNRLKYERCYEQHFFNSTLKQCQPINLQETGTNSSISSLTELNKPPIPQCVDGTTTLKQLCQEMAESSSLAEPGDCRRYLTCQEADEEPLTQRCRNGESFDSLLGFCRQNDGTCLMENGQRVGECSGKHGQLARDPTSCRNYFVCINGQKITQTCKDDEYFNKSQNMCLPDDQHVCSPTQQAEEPNKLSCAGLSESILYPYINDNCRSYFQCIKGEPKIHKCADDLYFDPLTIKCVKNKTDCAMPTQTLQRSPTFNLKFSKLCTNKIMELPYANVDNDCRSFYICHANGEITHEWCPLGKMFNKEFNGCFAESKTICS